MGKKLNSERNVGWLRPPNAIPLTAVVSGFLLSRAYFYWLGVRFETSSLEWYWQVLDPVLLANRLFESVFFLHAQPPAFNLMLGMGLKAAPVHSAALFQAAFLVLGLVVAVVIFLMLTRFELSPWIAAALVLLYATSPNWMMYESWLFYDFPVAAALVLAGAALLQAVRRSSAGWLVLFFALLAAVVWTRSLFHLVWFLACVGLVQIARPMPWRRVVAAAAVPLVLVVGLYTKNLVVFGFFGSSSWLGISLTKLTTAVLDPTDREQWVREGRLSAAALIPPFSPVGAYEAVGVPIPSSAVPALRSRLRSTGAPNFNHAAYLEISRHNLDDAGYVIRHRPGLYLRSVVRAAGRFFWSPVNYPPFRANLAATSSTHRFFESTVNVPWVAAMLGLLAATYGGMRTWRWLRGRGSPPDLLFAWSVLTMGWVFCVSSLLELGENFRFRGAVEPLVLILLGAMLGDLSRRRSSR